MRRINRNAMAILNDRKNGVGDFMCFSIAWDSWRWIFSCANAFFVHGITLQKEG